MKLTTGVNADGRILGVHADFIMDGGAYTSLGIASAYYAGAMLTLTYDFENYRFDMNRVYTNLPACGAQRGHGAPQPRYAFEAHLDNIAKELGIDPMEICTIAAAAERGLYAADGSGIRLVGDDLEQFIVSDYKKPASYQGGRRGMKHSMILSLVQAVGSWYVPRPEIDGQQCKACRKCELGCPVGAITMVGTVPHINRKKCIRCYCCHEMCSDGAIRLKRSRAGRLLAWIMQMEGS